MKNSIITISRQYGSGGREVGRRVAQQLDIPFYDRELIVMVAKESGLSLEYVEETAERGTNSLLYNIAMGGQVPGLQMSGQYMPVAEKMYIVQTKVIREIAEKGPCVIVGRTADYILKERDDCLNVFIHAELDFRVQRVIAEYGIDEKEAHKTVQKKDKGRAAHYRQYTDQEWGIAQSYHLCLDSGHFGLEETARLICSAARGG